MFCDCPGGVSAARPLSTVDDDFMSLAPMTSSVSKGGGEPAAAANIRRTCSYYEPRRSQPLQIHQDDREQTDRRTSAEPRLQYDQDVNEGYTGGKRSTQAELTQSSTTTTEAVPPTTRPAVVPRRPSTTTTTTTATPAITAAVTTTTG